MIVGRQGISEKKVTRELSFHHLQMPLRRFGFDGKDFFDTPFINFSRSLYPLTLPYSLWTSFKVDEIAQVDHGGERQRN